MGSMQFELARSDLPVPSTLTLESLEYLSAQYDKILLAAPQQKRHRIEPAELQRLDRLRYKHIPEQVSKRRTQDGGLSGGYLTKFEVQELTSWKLARGVFRPTLPSLVASNSDETIREVSHRGFSQYDPRSDLTRSQTSGPALKILSELRGVGTATASLLLAVAYPEWIPFFSDEIFHWASADSKLIKQDRIRYNAIEYSSIAGVVSGIQSRLSQECQEHEDAKKKESRPKAGNPEDELLDLVPKVRADDIERATFVIQKLQNPDIWEAVHGSDGNVTGAGSQVNTRVAKGGDIVEAVSTGVGDVKSAVALVEKPINSERRRKTNETELGVDTHGCTSEGSGIKRRKPPNLTQAPQRVLRSSKRRKVE